MINERDWKKTFDGIDEFFHKWYGITSFLLAYIIRKDPTPKEGEETDWDDQLEQMIERAPHTITEAHGTIIKHPTFVTDNKMAFDKLTELTREHECWTYLKPHARARNGREAYMAFKNHYLGPNNIGNMAATAEHKLINATYRGEVSHWDFERYSLWSKILTTNFFIVKKALQELRNNKTPTTHTNAPPPPIKNPHTKNPCTQQQQQQQQTYACGDYHWL